MDHTIPGATVPFGAVQLSPDTDTLPYAVNGKYNPDVYKYCAGYQYNDPTIIVFHHTHFSGTGHSDLGDFLVMPTVGDLQLNPGTAAQPESGYRSRFSHASPAVKEAVLKLENEKTFTVRAMDQRDANVYVEQVLLNGKALRRTWLTHTGIMNGGNLVFNMTGKPS